MSDKIMTRHPQGKKGVNIDVEKYELIKSTIIACVQNAGEISFSDLTSCVDATLSFSFDGSIAWYVTTVKLDLEARNLLERVPSRRPQHLRLIS